MLSDLTTLDVVAITIFFLVWFVYQMLFDGWWRRRDCINAQMAQLRRAWMRQLLARDNRIVDSTLVGHTMNSATFLASTTMLVLAGLIGVLGSAEQVYGAIKNITVLLGSGQRLFEWKLVLLIGIFIYAYFKFTWALRQFNYFCAVVGSAPDARTQTVDVETCADRMASVMSHAVAELNAGVRAYYFAFAAATWFLHPLVFIAATLLMVLVLARRQLSSPTAQLLREHAADLVRR